MNPRRTDAWHALGTDVSAASSAHDALDLAALTNWYVRKTPLMAVVGDYQYPVPGQYATVRDTPEGGVSVLGTVGEKYRVVQNEEHEALLDVLAEESGAVLDCAGTLSGGKKVFVTLRMPGFLLVGKADPVDVYLAAISGHDGRTAFTVLGTPVHRGTHSLLNFDLGGRVRHTSGVGSDALVQEARRTLDATLDHLDEFQTTAARLFRTPLSQRRFEQVVSGAFSAPKGAGANTVTRAANKIEGMANLFSSSLGLEASRGTAWGGLLAMVEWADHLSPTRGDEREVSRCTNAVLTPGFKAEALRLMLAEVR